MTDKTATKNWSDEAVATLLGTVGNVSPVTAELVQAAADALGKSTRSIASKLRSLDREVASLAVAKPPAFTQDEGDQLARFVQTNSGNYTYAEIAEKFMGGKFRAKQIQGKLLALELTGAVKPAEKVEAVSKYNATEEVKFVEMVNAGAFIEDIATAMGKEINSVRGKALSLQRKGQIAKMPAQRTSHAKTQVDPLESLGDKVAKMTVAEIAEATDKTTRGIKTMLTRRGVACADYDGVAKKEKAEAKSAA